MPEKKIVMRYLSLNLKCSSLSQSYSLTFTFKVQLVIVSLCNFKHLRYQTWSWKEVRFWPQVFRSQISQKPFPNRLTQGRILLMGSPWKQMVDCFILWNIRQCCQFVIFYICIITFSIFSWLFLSHLKPLDKTRSI